jgi:DNA modification methylase
VNTPASVQKTLGTVDWDFKESKRIPIHNIHSYPAKFIPELPRTLIELFYKNDGSAVLDPFCGSGTTVVEALNQGIDAIGIDINPLACLITKVKVSSIQKEELILSAKKIIEKARKNLEKGSISIPKISNLSHWFKLHIQKALSALIAEINKERDSKIKDALRVSFSSIVVRVSNQESDTRYASVEKNISAVDVFTYFQRAVETVANSVDNFQKNLISRSARTEIINKDLFDVTSNDIKRQIGLVITSPPYPNAYEYWLYHKYRMFWLGMDPLFVKSREIGARPHYFKKNPQSEVDFERQMGLCFKFLAKIMKPKAKACFLIGRSIIHGRHINNALILERSAQREGFKLMGAAERDILLSRKTFNLQYSKINKEAVIIFSLETP